MIRFKHKSTKNDINIEYKSSPIYLAKDMLLFYLNEKKDTTVFIDPVNDGRYYFDIEFLPSNALRSS